MNRAAIFAAFRAARPRLFDDPAWIGIVDGICDDAGIPRDGEHRRINAEGLALIKESEGMRLKAYICPAGVLTVGFGSTGPHVKPGMVITEAEAEALLRDDLARFERGVEKLTGGHATDNQFSAMVSLAFNVGLDAFKRSTLLRKHMEGDTAGAADEFARWTRANGKILPGLVKRRAKEAALYRRAGA